MELSQKASALFALMNPENPRHSVLRSTVEERIFRLSVLIQSDLANPNANKKSVQADIDYLLRLGLGEAARDIFLESRTKSIRLRIRQLKFDGLVTSYICDLSEVVFRLLRNTSDWYGGSFRENYMSSGFMKWLRTEIENYGDVFRKQVLFYLIARCLVLDKTSKPSQSVSNTQCIIASN